MQEWLHAQGVGPVDVLSVGSAVFSYLSEHIATTKEVKEAENF